MTHHVAGLSRYSTYTVPVVSSKLSSEGWQCVSDGKCDTGLSVQLLPVVGVVDGCVVVMNARKRSIIKC